MEKPLADLTQLVGGEVKRLEVGKIEDRSLDALAGQLVAAELQLGE